VLVRRAVHRKSINRKRISKKKELVIIPDAVHTDLYDRKDIIPFDKIQHFFEEYLTLDDSKSRTTFSAQVPF